MSKLVCFSHPHYNGSESPVLSCKACCSIFITEIKRQNGKQTASAQPTGGSERSSGFNMKTWLEKKAQEARLAQIQKHGHGINPT